MPSVIYDEHKGFCFDADSNASRSIVQIKSNGLDQLPWDAVFPEPEPEPENINTPPQVSEEVPNGSRKKLTKSEKKEAKQQKKISAARTRQSKRIQAAKDGNAKQDPLDNFNSFLATSDLKALHQKIVTEAKNHAANTTGSELKIFQYHSVALYKSDLDHMLPEEWLNDNNISFIFELVTQSFLKNSDTFHHQVQMLYPSLVQLFLHFPVSEEIEQILPLDDLKKSKFIFVPINFIDDYDDVNLEEVNNGDHWALGLLSILENRFYLYDSMSFDDENDPDSEKLLSELIKRLQSCKNIVKSNKPIEIIRMKCDQQSNFDDCGVYLIMITCYLVKLLIYSEQEAISLDISKVKFNALSGRLSMMELVYQVLKDTTR